MRVFLAGATGLIGVPLVRRLSERGDQPVVLSRRPQHAQQQLGSDVEVIEGNPQQYGEWARHVDGCQAVMNLAGEPVIGKRWNAGQKQVLRDSRIESTRNLVRALGEAAERPGVLVNASAIGYYGNVPEGELTEKSSQGDDFLAQLCGDWEAAALTGRIFGARVALVRVGVVLARQGGALSQMMLPFKLGLGGPIGHGKAWFSWIHRDDIVGVFLTALDHPEACGPINGTAPEPVRNKTFSQLLAAALHRPCLFPILPVALRLRFGEVANVIIGSQRVLPAQLEQLGYAFKFRTCEAALAEIVRGTSP